MPVRRRRAGAVQSVRARRRLAYGVVAGLVVLVLAAFGAGRGAGPRLTAASPGDGATLGTPPAVIELTFTGSPDASGSHLTVAGGPGTDVTAGPVHRDGTHRLALPVSLRGNGSYDVAYHVVFADGTELVGRLGFTVGAPSTGGAPAADPHDHGVDPVGAVLLLADAIVLIVVVALLLRRPRRPLIDLEDGKNREGRFQDQ